jgi:hypothetical protein
VALEAFANSTLSLLGQTELRPPGSLCLSDPRDLLVSRSVRGAYRQDRRVDQDTLRVYGTAGRFPDAVPERLSEGEVVEVSDEDVVWGGGLVAQFGHFLTESVSRLWPLLPGGSLSGMRVVFTTPSRRPYVVEWLAAFGAQVVELPREGLVRFKRMYVPEPAWRLNAWVAPEIRDVHLHARENLEVPRLPKRDLIWLSRSALDRERTTHDEKLLEWLLKDHLTVVHPETMSLSEQVGVVESGKRVAGILGSASHSLLLAREPPKGLYLSSSRVMSTYVAQNELLGRGGTFVHALSASRMKRIKKFRSPGIYRLLIPETLRALGRRLPPILEDPILASLTRPETFDSSRQDASDDGSALASVARVLIDPLSLKARMDLGAQFERDDQRDCAIEQFAMVADLTDDYAYGPLRAARALYRGGRRAEAEVMARRALEIDPGLKEAERYVPSTK